MIPFSGLFNVTLALGTRAPVESETEPENEAVEASVWPCATGTVMPTKMKTIAKNRTEEKLSEAWASTGTPIPFRLRYR